MMTRTFKVFFLSLLFALGVAGCGSVEVSKYKDQKPELDLRTYLNGTIDAWGMFQGRDGEVVAPIHGGDGCQMGRRHRRT